MGTDTVQNIYFYVPQKKIIQVWSNIRVSKWQSLIFGWTIPLNVDKCNRKLSVCTTNYIHLDILANQNHWTVFTIIKICGQKLPQSKYYFFPPMADHIAWAQSHDAYDPSSMNKRWMEYRPTGRVVNSLSDLHLPLWSYCSISFKDNWAGTKGWCITFNMYLWI